jgi:spore coat polysaccharide biosynthesis protein SpsF (cytidylyltransferase family)
MNYCLDVGPHNLQTGEKLKSENGAIAILQARMSSRRLPGKMLADIVGHPLLWHVINRVKASQSLKKVVVATTDSESDDPIVDFCENHKISCFRGSETDVLDRFFQAALSVNARTIVRITGDCPLLDPKVIDLIVGRFDQHEPDYASNAGWINEDGEFYGRTYPDGLDVEVCSFEALERAWHEAKLPSDREHVMTYIYKNPAKFRIEQVTQDVDLSSLRWTVDEPEDLEFVRHVFSNLYSPEHHFTTEDVLALLQSDPKLKSLNMGFAINEGYRDSIQKDRAEN